MRLRILEPAATEAAEATVSYAAIDPTLGEDFRQAIAEALETVREAPRRQAVWRYTRRQRVVRRLLLRRFPYSVIYEIREDQVVVAAIAHWRRRPGY